MTSKMQGLRELTDVELDQVHGAAINLVFSQVNGGGNTPNGNANGVPIVTENQNPSGFPPPGHNK